MDSIRGLAATSVILAHISIIIPSTDMLEKLNKTPLHLFWLGHESVILFFILSGFVLSIPYYNNKVLKYKDYLIRRICRILIPNGISVLLILILMNVLSLNSIAGVSEWANTIWSTPLTLEMIVNHFILLKEFDTMTLNPVIWSLIHEMRISLLFPFMMWLIVRRKRMGHTIILLSIPIIYFLSYYISLKVFSYDITTFSGGYSSYLLTPHYAAFFILGALLAKYRGVFSKLYDRLSTAFKIAILVIGFILYMYEWLVLPNHSLLHMFIINDWAIALGSCIFIMFSLNSKTLKWFLSVKPVHFIGKISFSLYLYHLIVMMTLLYSLSGKMSVLAILVVSFVVTFIIATIMHYLVEVPSVKLGRLLTAKHNSIISTKQQLDSKIT